MTVKLAGVPLLLTLGSVLCLSGCANPNDSAANLLAEPGKYTFYECSDLKTAAKALAKRAYDLEQLTRKAGAGMGGRLVSSVTYEPQAMQARGDLNNVREAAAAKHCDFVHGVDDVWDPVRDGPKPPPPKPAAKKPAKKIRRP